LNEGEFRAGWKVHDWRLVPGSPYEAPTAFADLSMWEGEFLSEQRLLVIITDGFGDQIFSLRYLQALAEEGAKIEIAVGPELSALVRSSFPSMTVHDLENARQITYWQNKPPPDFWTYALSIPSRTDLWEPLQTAGYLMAPKNLVQQYQLTIDSKLQLQNLHKLPVYGVTWHGKIQTAAYRTRAYTVQQFLRESGILKAPCLIVCLQNDATPEELAELQAETAKAGCQLLNAAPTLQDFAHTAAWISCVDQMWSCDTAVAHLAGALGVRTTVMIRNKAIWHWRCDATTQQSVWYDSCHIKYALSPAISYMFEIRTE
jgi:ADP-heptose:LPS heptosyltransferase